MKDAKVTGVSDNGISESEEKQADGGEDKDLGPISREELIEQFETQISYFECLPQHYKFSPCTNADLQYFMIMILGLLKLKD